MTELKTLKDIFHNDEIDIAELRQEAIKWIKFNASFAKRGSTLATGANKWIKQFFNITDEELK